MTTCKSSRIAIAGGGAWGLSTALHLLDSGYANITVYERAERIPSPYSAAFDLNKIVRPEYEDGFYTNLALVSRYRYRQIFSHHSTDTHFRRQSKAGRPPCSDLTTTTRDTSLLRPDEHLQKPWNILRKLWNRFKLIRRWHQVSEDWTPLKISKTIPGSILVH